MTNTPAARSGSDDRTDQVADAPNADATAWRDPPAGRPAERAISDSLARAILANARSDEAVLAAARLDGAIVRALTAGLDAHFESINPSGLDALHGRVDQALSGGPVPPALDAAVREMLGRHADLAIGLVQHRMLDHLGVDPARACALGLGLEGFHFRPKAAREHAWIEIEYDAHDAERSVLGLVVSVAGSIKLDGDRAVLARPLPATILTVAPSLRLAQILSHPALDGLDVPIRSAACVNENWTSIGILQPGYLRMRDLAERMPDAPRRPA